MKTLIAKAWRRVSHRMVYRARRWRIYPYLYPATWRAAFRPADGGGGGANYLTVVPNRGAGIGHQIANWVAGYWFAQAFDCSYAYTPFPDADWDGLLNFGEGEMTLSDLCRATYARVRLPLFDEEDDAEMSRIRAIIRSYDGRRVVFILERDQFHRAQIGVRKSLAGKFANSEKRRTTPLVYDPSNLNIAVHVRRGDVSIAAAEADENIRKRWQDTDYFEKLLDHIVALLRPMQQAHVYVFSQGEAAEFASFAHHPRLTLCLDMNAAQSFVHLATADILIASKSGFSYAAALLNSHGIRAVPKPFWHDYPDDPDWIEVAGDGAFDAAKMEAALNRLSRRE